jgi:Family of unknown function (DUF5946)
VRAAHGVAHPTAGRHHQRVPSPAPAGPTETCPGCGAVLVAVPDDRPAHPGASPSCSRLFEVTLRGLREETGADPAAAAAVRLADHAYAAQHPVSGDRPQQWRTTIADVAADLDVIDLPALIESWARGVDEDWAGLGTGSSVESRS